MSAHVIIWSPTANVTYLEILDYLKENWTSKELQAFIDRTEEVINYIDQNPSHYPYSKQSDSFKCIVVAQVSLFYRVRHQRIELLSFWDNRRDPAKLSL